MAGVDPLLELLAACVVPIERDGAFEGTGFWVAPGEVLTCAHVVHGGKPISVTVGSQSLPAEPASPLLAPDDQAAKFYPQPDAALLRVPDAPAGHPCVRLDPTTPAVGADLLQLASWTVGENAPGRVVRSGASLHLETLFSQDGVELFKLREGLVLKGFSGGPLLNRRTGGVCALVDSSRSIKLDLGGFGVPIALIEEHLPGLLDRNAAFHATDPDRRWVKAVEAQRVVEAQRAGDSAGLRNHPDPDRLPPRSVLVASLVAVVLSPLSGAAINYATDGPVPAVLSPLARWPWWSGLVLTVVSAALVLWTCKATRSAARHGLSPGDRERARRHLALRVRTTWIDGVLTPTLAHGAWTPTLVERPSAVPDLYGRTTGPEEHPDRPVESGTTLAALVERYGRRVVILGGQGAGKTTALLSLTRELLRSAEGQDRPVPVVFQLSRWAQARLPLRDWLAGELTNVYKLRKKEAAELLAGRLVLPMLDGLDELSPQNRAPCVDAINRFRDDGPDPPPLVVTCRSGDYRDGPPLELAGAIVVEPLSIEQVDGHLSRGGRRLAGLRDAYRGDRTVQAILRSPLMLQLATTAFADTPKVVASDLDDVLSSYVDRLTSDRSLTRRGDFPDRPRFPDAVFRSWLGWLARTLQSRKDPLFRPDALDVDTLSRPRYRRWVVVGTAWLLGVCGGVTAGVLQFADPPPWTPLDYLDVVFAAGAAAGLIAAAVLVDPPRAGAVVSWNWSAALAWRRPAIVALLVCCVVGAGLIVTIKGPDVGAGTVTLIVLACGLLLLRGVEVAPPAPVAAVPDEGLRVSGRNAVLLWITVNLAAGVLVGAVLGAIRQTERLNAAVDYILLMWLVGALVTGVWTGCVLLLAPSTRPPSATPRRSRAVTATGIAVAAPAAILVDVGLDAWTWFGSLHKWIGTPIVIALVVGLIWGAASLARRYGPPFGRPTGLFLLAFSTVVLIRVMRWIAVGWEGRPAVFITIAVGAAAVVCLFGGGSAWVRQQLIRNLLAREEGAPRRLMAFLDDAENRGVLLRAGDAYLFRHVEVQRYLAGVETGPPGSAPEPMPSTTTRR